ncbi:hypothetical protein ACH5RR_017780 [Cinchona calisaya]|uniref:Uncharacterized protein n=1 Tax=Cinchona calisaya TaxID=153742 RepID=A0ABD2ZJP7_9GENT
MAVADDKSASDGKVWGLFKLPFRNFSNSSTSSLQHQSQHQNQQQYNTRVDGSITNSNNPSSSVSFVARSLLPTWHRLKLDPSNKLYFSCIFTFFFAFRTFA